MTLIPRTALDRDGVTKFRLTLEHAAMLEPLGTCLVEFNGQDTLCFYPCDAGRLNGAWRVASGRTER